MFLAAEALPYHFLRMCGLLASLTGNVIQWQKHTGMPEVLVTIHVFSNDRISTNH